ncbi:hypothetical protein D917_01471 [Trichinella nativa]|uniref:Uncharacterized protein n=1 Tax=Trichinella nativa TaxID=6335 RepID=A0A1Y3ER79_9BILA|nr:hypothetical protein D917_01471 [Trichinella nativa]
MNNLVIVVDFFPLDSVRHSCLFERGRVGLVFTVESVVCFQIHYDWSVQTVVSGRQKSIVNCPLVDGLSEKQKIQIHSSCSAVEIAV